VTNKYFASNWTRVLVCIKTVARELCNIKLRSSAEFQIEKEDTVMG